MNGRGGLRGCRGAERGQIDSVVDPLASSLRRVAVESTPLSSLSRTLFALISVKSVLVRPSFNSPQFTHVWKAASIANGRTHLFYLQEDR